MKYLQKFEKFKLLLEKINKDRDYYTARLEDLETPVTIILSNLLSISQKLEKSGGVQASDIKKDLVPQIMEAFMAGLKEAYTLDYNDEEEINKIFDRMLVFEQASGSEAKIKIFQSTEIYFISRRNKKGDFLYDGLEIKLDFSKPRLKIKLDKDFEKNTSKENLQNLKLELTRILDKMSEISLQLLSTSDPNKKLQVKLLCKAGKSVEEISYETGFTKNKIIKLQIEDLIESPFYDSKKVGYVLLNFVTIENVKKEFSRFKQIWKQVGLVKLSDEELKKYISEIEAQAQSQKEIDYSSPQSQKEKPEFVDPLAKKITDWEVVLENFKNYAKKKLENYKDAFIEFEIELDKFKSLLEKNGYKFNLSQKEGLKEFSTFKDSICKPIINSFIVKLRTNKPSIYDSLHKNYYFILVCYSTLLYSHKGLSGLIKSYDNVAIDEKTIFTNKFKLKPNQKTATVKGFVIIQEQLPSPSNPVFVEKEEDINYY